MKPKELRTKSNDELEKLLSGDRSKLRRERFESANAKSKNIKISANIKKEIARILTVLREKK